MGKNYYSVLGVERSATLEEIKKAYKRQAIRWHPDKNQDNIDAATEKFKEIAEAYDVLSTPDKRQVFDRYGSEGVDRRSNPQSQNHHNVDPNDIFQAFFGGANAADIFSQFQGMNGGAFIGGRGMNFTFGGPDIFAGGFPQQPQRRRKATMPLDLTLEEISKGCVRRENINGREIDLAIPAGVKAGTIVESGGVEFTVREKVHAIFTRDGSTVRHVALVTLAEFFLTGRGNYKIKSLEGREISVNLPTLGQMVRIPGRGITGGDLEISSLFVPYQQFEAAKALAKGLGALLLFFMVTLNPQFVFLFLLLRPLFS